MTPKTLDTPGMVLMALAGIGWFLMLANVVNLVGKSGTGDAAMGKALSTFATLLFVALTWVAMALLLLRAGAHDVLPSWASVAAFILYFLSGAAAIAAVFLLDDPKKFWPAAVPILTPLLIVGYVVCASQPALRQMMVNPAIGGLVWAAVLLLSLAPWPSVFRAQAESEKHMAEAEEIRKQQDADASRQRREKGLAQIAQMRPESHLWDWFSLLDAQSGVQAEALGAFRTNPNRQADLEYALGDSISSMEYVPALDIQPTPKLCEAAARWCTKFASQMLPQNGQPSYYEEKKLLDLAMKGLRWFQANNCPLEHGLIELEAGLRTYRDTPHRRQMLDQLQQLRVPPR